MSLIEKALVVVVISNNLRVRVQSITVETKISKE